MNDKGCEELINAIILQAFKDYHWASRKIRRDPENLTALKMIADVERFCRGRWITFLTDVDGLWILERIKSWRT